MKDSFRSVVGDRRTEAEVEALLARNKEDYRATKSKIVNREHVLLTIFVGCMLLLSCFSMRVKLAIMHFAVVKSFKDWCLHEWLLTFGFLNQLAGVCNAEHIE